MIIILSEKNFSKSMMKSFYFDEEFIKLGQDCKISQYDVIYGNQEDIFQKTILNFTGL